MNPAGLKLRTLLNTNTCNNCASVYDPLSARMAESIGFQVGILGGSVSSLTQLGAPDISLITLSELVGHAKRVCSASELPVVVDGDNGYGNALNVMRTIQELELAGAAGITIEDTPLPKRHNSTNTLCPISEATCKLQAAVEARKHPETVIVARTPADDSQPLSSILERVKSYTGAGVDAICAFGLTNPDTLAAIQGATDLPIMVISYGDNRLGSHQALADQRVRILMRGHIPFEEAVKATYLSLKSVYSDQPTGAEEADSVQGKSLIARFSHVEGFSETAKRYGL
jgi:carboxyvinyl-carboxyphosphonate phosphorylmutase